ncbi:MAG: alpha/beta hydrolase, partial [Salinimicrobium sp.]
MKKRFWIFGAVVIIMVVTWFSGPRIPHPHYDAGLPHLPNQLPALEDYVKLREAEQPVRKNNEARILWQNEVPKKTEFSIVYLHGFAGSWRDGYPVNVKIADILGANIYLSRWAGHGLKPTAALKDFSSITAWESAKEALVIGKKIGNKVIIMSTSTGGTLALKLAATYPDSVYALINMSPNIEDEFDGSFLLNSPWGYELAQLVSFGDERKIDHEEKAAPQYFDTVYPSNALVDLQVLVGTTMNEKTYKKINCPVLTLFYYKNFLEEDKHVEVEEYPEVYEQLSTPEEFKKLVRLEEPKSHFMGSDIKSENTGVVVDAIVDFLKTTLHLHLDEKKKSLDSADPLIQRDQ